MNIIVKFKQSLKGIHSVIRYIGILFIPLMLIAITAAPVFACIITITPGNASGAVGDTLTFTINVQKTHRTCLVPIDETQIKLQGMEIVSQTAWKQISSDINQKKITVRLVQAGDGSIRVIRICSKGGDDETVKVSIKPAQPAGQSSPSAQPPAPTTPVQPLNPINASAPAVLPAAQTQPPTVENNTDSADPTWWEAFVDGITQPHIIALLILTVLGTIFLMLRFRRFRYLTLLTSLAYLGFIVGGCPCVLGSLQNMILQVGEIKYHIPTYLQVGIPLVFAVFFGRVFCGWVCPMGAVQHFVYRKEAGKKARSIDPGPRLHNVLRYVKYLVLVILVVAVLITRTTIFASIDPFKALFNLEFTDWIPTTLLILLLIAALFIGFPFCKYTCPLGAFLGLFSKFTLFKVNIGDKCTNCKACHTTYCDYKAIKPGETRPEVNQVECVRCGECISRCPLQSDGFHNTKIDPPDNPTYSHPKPTAGLTN